MRIGARTSPLARTQADQVAAALQAQGVETTFVGITTTGDVDQRNLTEIGGTGIFASAVREALYSGEIDLGVHSLKDLPTAQPEGLVIAAVPPREDTRDVLIGRPLTELGNGARIGTGAPRRAVQLEELARRLGVEWEIVPIRGNVERRIGLVESETIDAIVLAAAGLSRLGYLVLADSDNYQPVVNGLRATLLSHDDMLPAPGQGALALEIHVSLSKRFRAVVEALDDSATHAESLVERGFLGQLEAGCTAPVGAAASVEGVHGTSLDLTLNAVIGRTLLSNLSEPANSAPLRWTASGSSTDPWQFGVAAADEVLAQLRAG